MPSSARSWWATRSFFFLPAPLGSHPFIDPITQIRLIEGTLQHAPYPFRTLSGTQGALSYLDAVFPILPWSTSQGRTVSHVVIHCLPGLYGPTTVGGMPTPIDPGSGLPFNGESLPIRIERDRVCLQGTSALDTIFDARGAGLSILEIGSASTPPDGFRQTFIDSIAFRGARHDANVRGSGAGIWVRGASPVRAFVSNCFVYDNVVGLALDAARLVSPASITLHRMYIVNNTFAWNGIGIWAGDTAQPTALRQHASLIVNNIFDSAPRPGTFAAAVGAASCFEGVPPSNLLVQARGAASIGPLDFNAWHPGRANLGTVAPPGWPAVAQPAGWGAFTPRVDMTPFGSWPRTFFVGDALANSPAQLDSRHDLRLCPYVSSDGTAPGVDLATLVSNPCIDAGIDSGQSRDRAIGTQSLFGPAALPGYGPGLPSYLALTQQQPNPNVKEAPITGWDFDTDGFGNPRVIPDLPEPTEQHFGYIDIGADEVDGLIVAGYVDRTRILTAPPVPNAAGMTVDHRRVFFFGRPGASSPRPLANTVLGKPFGWFGHVQTPFDATNGNYTGVQQRLPPTQIPPLRWVQITTPPGFNVVARPPIPRYLECDISPHLAGDFYPLWGTPLMGFADTSTPLWMDAYAVNPWFDSMPQFFGAGNEEDRLVDNQCLFHNRLGAAHQTFLSTPPNSFLPPETFVVSGHVNSPGSFIPASPGDTRLLQAWGTAAFGPFGTCTSTTLQFGSWCVNDLPAGCPDTLPEFAGEASKGRRFNLEILPDPQTGRPRSNLQTFLFIFPGELPAQGPWDPSSTSDLPPREMDARIQEQENGR
jgi:hypothetical protein